jgi:hypothetical protein
MNKQLEEKWTGIVRTYCRLSLGNKSLLVREENGWTIVEWWGMGSGNGA